MYLCLCKGIRAEDLRRLGSQGVREPAQIIAVLHLDDPECCGSCLGRIQEFAGIASQPQEQPPPIFSVPQATSSPKRRSSPISNVVSHLFRRRGALGT